MARERKNAPPGEGRALGSDESEGSTLCSLRPGIVSCVDTDIGTARASEREKTNRLVCIYEMLEGTYHLRLLSVDTTRSETGSYSCGIPRPLRPRAKLTFVRTLTLAA